MQLRKPGGRKRHDHMLQVTKTRGGRVQIVVTCTSRKRRPVPMGLCFRTISASTAPVRHAMWAQALRDAPVDVVAATDLYGGDSWQIARSLPAQASGNDAAGRAELWVASAGYGLVNESALLKPYAATFAGRHPDTVIHPGDPGDQRSRARRWWQLLTSDPGPDRYAPRSLAALAATHSGELLLVVASASYLAALADDLVAARNALAAPEHLLIVSVGGCLGGLLANNLLPADARLRMLVGGTLSALNLRVSRWLLERVGPGKLTLPAVHAELARALAALEAWTPATGTRLSSTEVRQFILSAQAEQPGLSRTALLRRLRAAGYACEQARFAAIMRSAEESLDGPA